MTSRTVVELIRARPASDGAGVKLLRVFGGQRAALFDPFLMLDEFGSESADDYIGGFPPHPHRGFETITYMLQGKMEHQDHMGNIGLLNDGDVQWMTAAHGIIHSEMPKQTAGKMRGFQLWLNLAADKKMQPAAWRDLPAQEVPSFEWEGVHVKALAGRARVNGQAVLGYFERPDTQPVYLDVHLAPGAAAQLELEANLNALVYSYDGEVAVAGTAVPSQTLARLTPEGLLELTNTSTSISRCLVLAGVPLKQPIVQHGPFVMNTQQEIEQAIRDYHAGVLAV